MKFYFYPIPILLLVSAFVFANDDRFEFDQNLFRQKLTINNWIIMTDAEVSQYFAADLFADSFKIPFEMESMVSERAEALCQLQQCGDSQCNEVVQVSYQTSYNAGNLVEFNVDSLLPKIRAVDPPKYFIPHVIVKQLSCKKTGFTSLELSNAIHSLVDEKNADPIAHAVFALYQDYISNRVHDYFEFIQEEILSGKFTELPVQNLRIELTKSEIEAIFNKNKIIQLRKIDPNLKKLVVGCGNRPIAYQGAHLVEAGDTYSEEHAHEDSITVDPELLKNATLVAEFGIDSLTDVLPLNHFDLIIFEGYFPTDVKTIHQTLREVRRLLSPQGKAYVYDGHYWPIDVLGTLRLIQYNPWVSPVHLKDIVLHGVPRT